MNSQDIDLLIPTIIYGSTLSQSQAHNMLLKEGQASPDLSKFIDKSILGAIKDEIISKFDIQFGILPAEIEQKLKSIVKHSLESLPRKKINEITKDFMVRLVLARSKSFKVGFMNRDAINKNCNKGILGVHIVGFIVAFYVTTLVAEGLYVIYELCSITMPSSLHDMRAVVTDVEDLLPVKDI
ncbi:hypothetical protein G6F68_006461 [Rhizopus microsporus]|nr:hypothetical protein G6F67_008018 [Rhizopus microsporus]KAG1261752.1 hypothetical protein G6F68_006461 [Rhizopus microsporus]